MVSKKNVSPNDVSSRIGSARILAPGVDPIADGGQRRMREAALVQTGQPLAGDGIGVDERAVTMLEPPAEEAAEWIAKLIGKREIRDANTILVSLMYNSK